jgi:hypothetical protein
MTKSPTYTHANITVPNNGAPLGSTANYTSGMGVNSDLTSTGTGGNFIVNTRINTGTVKITDSDVEIGGLSLKATLQAINERLAVLIPNPALEREFDELRACGDEYRRLERELQEQIRVWNVLKKTD